MPNYLFTTMPAAYPFLVYQGKFKVYFALTSNTEKQELSANPKNGFENLRAPNILFTST